MKLEVGKTYLLGANEIKILAFYNNKVVYSGNDGQDRIQEKDALTSKITEINVNFLNIKRKGLEQNIEHTKQLIDIYTKRMAADRESLASIQLQILNMSKDS